MASSSAPLSEHQTHGIPPVAPPSVASPNQSEDPLFKALLGGTIGSGTVAAATLRNGSDGTLDEPVLETLRRDATMVLNKAAMVLALSVPPDMALRNWDLWGPLANSLLLSICLAMGTTITSSMSAFAVTFAAIWLGALAVTLNMQMLGFRVALLPTISFLGYCLTPLVGAALILFIFVPAALWPAKVLLIVLSVIWAMKAALRLFDLEPALEDRRWLAAFPASLYFGLLAWLSLIA